MFTARTRKGLGVLAGLAVASLALAGCGASSDPLSNNGGDASASSAEIVVGSQAYFSNEIIAEIYAQALENSGLTVKRQFQIGQRDAYIPLLEDGTVTVFPEYSGNLLQFFDKETTARTADEVYAALPAALPEGLEVLDQSSATDQDSYTVTKAFADANGLTSIADLSKVTTGLTLGGNAELAERPYGPQGLKSTYGVDVQFSPTGETTVDDLVAGTIQVANVYTADPRIQTDNLVTLEDPKGLFLASNVVPVVNSKVASQVSDVLNKVSAALTPEGLVELNVKSTVDQQSSADIAKAWLADNNL
ncbi:MAG: glycine/betaine ABC transporter [Microbacterium sp. 71-36]|uniref:ABC transporter substrate-binding protein n=1 Tax=unclassified Microbacterium TaxID=2609290 RepID=UPI00086C1F71|nr:MULTISPECIES: ABC transporter substrate-binding protein [unclassified Microbacterium]MBN9210800.1 ABC transporter substrate-binding protein [Microbacterium sp.]ODT42165.1 MAG: glycine/betaine ABC transporter [Microbacterium sp. SCN 71-17]OJV77457.1 MAG: glycine/betaine ABC transporter [Microbacterium sp. 71-36]